MTANTAIHRRSADVQDQAGIACDSATPRMNAEIGSDALLSAVKALCDRQAKILRITPQAALWLMQDRPSIAEIQARFG